MLPHMHTEWRGSEVYNGAACHGSSTVESNRTPPSVWKNPGLKLNWPFYRIKTPGQTAGPVCLEQTVHPFTIPFDSGPLGSPLLWWENLQNKRFFQESSRQRDTVYQLSRWVAWARTWAMHAENLITNLNIQQFNNNQSKIITWIR